jgi:hypothetical protein
MDLDMWLAATDPSRIGRSDALAVGSTNCAFAFNGTIGVVKAHASNMWVNDWDEGDDQSARLTSLGTTMDSTSTSLMGRIPKSPAQLQFGHATRCSSLI